MTTTQSTPPSLAELEAAHAAALAAFHTAHRDAWNAAVLRADLNSAWDADDDAHRAAWNAAVRRAALDKEQQ